MDMSASVPIHRRNANTVDRKSTRLNSSHTVISYAVFCLKKKKIQPQPRAVCDAGCRPLVQLDIAGPYLPVGDVEHGVCSFTLFAPASVTDRARSASCVSE